MSSSSDDALSNTCLTPPAPPSGVARVLGVLKALVVTFVVATAIIVSAGRWWMPRLNDRAELIASLASTFIGANVRLGAIHGRWQRFSPIIELSRIVVLAEDGETVALSLDHATIELDLLSSVVRRTPVPKSLTLRDLSLVVERMPDGRIRLSGTGAANAQGMNNEAAMRWLLDRDNVMLTDAHMVYIDRKTGAEPQQLDDIRIGLRRLGGQHQLSLTLTPPVAMGASITLNARIRGEILTGNWDGLVAIDTEGMRLAQVLKLAQLSDNELAGRLTLHLTSEWRAGQLIAAAGDVVASNLRAGVNAEIMLNSFSSDVSAQRQADGSYHLGLRDLTLETPATQYMTERADLIWQTADGRPTYVVFNSAALHLDAMLPLLAQTEVLPAAVRELVAATRPAGVLNDVHAAWFREDGVTRYALAASLSNVAITPATTAPRVTGISGDLRLNGNGGRFFPATQAIDLIAGDVLVSDVAVTGLQGDVLWQHRDDLWRVQLPDFRATVASLPLAIRGEVRWPTEGGRPFADVIASVSGGNAADMQLLLPRDLLRPTGESWLRNVAHQGEIAYAGLVLRGISPIFHSMIGKGGFWSQSASTTGRSNIPDVGRLRRTLQWKSPSTAVRCTAARRPQL